MFAASESGEALYLCYFLRQPLTLCFPLNTVRLLSMSSLYPIRDITSLASESVASRISQVNHWLSLIFFSDTNHFLFDLCLWSRSSDPYLVLKPMVKLVLTPLVTSPPYTYRRSKGADRFFFFFVFLFLLSLLSVEDQYFLVNICFLFSLWLLAFCRKNKAHNWWVLRRRLRR